MVVGICRVRLYFPQAGSLKEKRQGLRRLLDRLRAKFNAAVAEVADQDDWKRATIGLCVVGNEGGHVRSMLDKMLAFTEQLYVGHVLDRELDIVHYNDSEALSTDAEDDSDV